MTEKFWLVWCEKLATNPRKRDSEPSAAKEAERLALDNPGKTFVVLEAKTATTKSGVDVVVLEDPIPF